MERRRIRITVNEGIESELVEGLPVVLETFGPVFQAHEARVVFVLPFAEKESLLVDQLNTWVSEGLLVWQYAN